MKKTTSKKPRTLSEMAEKLQKRGLTNKKGINLGKYLFDMNYYRLSGFWRYYQVDPLHGQNDFVRKIDIAEIKDLYDLDTELRRLVLEGIQIFEPIFRARLAYAFAHTFGKYGYLNPKTYITANRQNPALEKNRSKRVLDALKKSIKKSKEPCIEHFVGNNELIPVWTIVEVLTIDTVVNMFCCCNNFDCKASITSSFGIGNNSKRFAKILKAIVVLRNLCSHHSRLWNRIMSTSPSLPYIISDKYPSMEAHSVMQALIPLMELIDRIKDNNLYSSRINELINKNNEFKKGLYSPQPNKVRWGKVEL